MKTLSSYQAKRRRRKLLKDKKIEILYPQVVSDNIGNQVTEWVKMTVSPLWAYFRQLGGDEYYAAR
ncbi:MAG: head-tail adaptor protein, partial [Peptococcaceae bacterium]|nr:head-tail adaptor protein [Peptococcaceae bacterium]